MLKIRLLGILLVLFGPFACSGQSIDSLKLSDAEIPTGYSKSDQMVCITPHGCSVYEQSGIYETILGKVVRKDFQSFAKKGDRGSILYFESESDFKGQAFLDGLLWGQESKPTKAEPDEYYSKGKILVIWSFDLKSELKLVSKSKVTRLLQ